MLFRSQITALAGLLATRRRLQAKVAAAIRAGVAVRDVGASARAKTSEPAALGCKRGRLANQDWQLLISLTAWTIC